MREILNNKNGASKKNEIEINEGKCSFISEFNFN